MHAVLPLRVFLKPIKEYHNRHARNATSTGQEIFSLPASFQDAILVVDDMVKASGKHHCMLVKALDGLGEEGNVAPIIVHIAGTVERTFSKFISVITAITFGVNKWKAGDRKFKDFLDERYSLLDRGISLELLLMIPLQKSMGYNAMVSAW